MKRKLASIQKIDNIKPIDDADSIEVADILGWKCVVKKGEFTPGDYCVYFEIDSILPEAEWSEFLGSNKRIKTRKFKGQISQGLALPLHTFHAFRMTTGYREAGIDVTDVLGVTKWEPQELDGKPITKSDAIGPFPTSLGFLKTDETRIQAIPELIDSLKGKPYYITHKIDGTSVTFFTSPETNRLEVCSRNLNQKRPSGKGVNLYWDTVLKNVNEQTLTMYYSKYAFQGEIYGQGIQKNRSREHDIKLAIYNIYDMEDHRYLSLNEIYATSYPLHINVVPLVEQGECFSHNIDTLTELARSYSPYGVLAEGIVVRPKYPEYNSLLGRDLSFKVINTEYLLKHGC